MFENKEEIQPHTNSEETVGILKNTRDSNERPDDVDQAMLSPLARSRPHIKCC